MPNYLETVADVYAQAAVQPDATLCCGVAPVWRFPGLFIPQVMLKMNYGCGSTVGPGDLSPEDTVLYVGVGGGLEALQFAYFTRRPGGVVVVDPVAAMRARARSNFEEAARLNPWFRPNFITLLDGSALDLPVADQAVTVIAQNCLFNVFTAADLKRALAEAVRVLKVGGLFALSDPVTPVPLPAALTSDATLRARCVSGCQTLPDYLAALTGAGFGRVEVRARFPYRYLDPRVYPALAEPVLLESIEVAAYKVPEEVCGPAIFTGRTAIYIGPADHGDDGSGSVMPRGIPVPVSDGAAQRLAGLPDFKVTLPTWRARGGCC
jgi:ubiquinone/menaquinone biosynthesis C-methylase UbiE